MSISAIEEKFDRLRSEWHETLAQSQKRREERRRVVAQEWELAFDRLVSEQRELMRKGQWIRGADDLLSVIGQSRRETYHSAIIAWLLDPLGRHRMGDAFLSGFLKATDSGPADGERLIRRVECEVVCPSGRADIVIYGEGFTVVIENKVDAVESLGQCQKYVDDFGEQPDVSFVFLSPRGRRPISISEELAHVYSCISYPRLLDILNEASPPGKDGEHSVVAEYRKTLINEFS